MPVQIMTFKVDKKSTNSLYWYDSKGNFVTASHLDRAFGYFAKDQLSNIPAMDIESYRIRDYAEAVELLHGYTLALRDSLGNYYGVPEHQYLASQMKQAILEVADYLSKKAEICAVNIVDPAGRTVHTAFDKNGNYIEPD